MFDTPLNALLIMPLYLKAYPLPRWGAWPSAAYLSHLNMSYIGELELPGIGNAIALPPCHVNRHDELLLQKTGPVVMIRNLDHGYSQLDF